jgi:hypothetical protein
MGNDKFVFVMSACPAAVDPQITQKSTGNTE